MHVLINVISGFDYILLKLLYEATDVHKLAGNSITQANTNTQNEFYFSFTFLYFFSSKELGWHTWFIPSLCPYNNPVR